MTAEDITGPGTPAKGSQSKSGLQVTDAKGDSGQWLPGLGFGKQTKPSVPEMADPWGGVGLPFHEQKPRVGSQKSGGGEERNLAASGTRRQPEKKNKANVPEGVRHILIVDDTFTTGSTLAACYSALRECVSGEVRISVATLAFVKNN